MTTPRTNYYSAQLQSSLFRLPREVRDTIYAYYVVGEDGYHYDSETGKMLYATEPKQTVRLGLMITCRIAHEELKHMVFRKIHFSTLASCDDGRSYMGLGSRAGRFKCMLRYVERQKRRILIKVSGLLQYEDFLDLYARYPSVKGWFHEPLQQSVAQQVDFLHASEGHSDQGELASGEFADAIQYALVCARTRNGPEFAKLARETFGQRMCPIDRHPTLPWMNIFVEGALYDVFSWHPEAWKIPDDDELAKLEALICSPGLCFAENLDTELPMTHDGFFYFPDLDTHVRAAEHRWFFSATSVAIGFLQQMSRTRRLNLRTIVLNEDNKAVSRPELHTRGLVPFCIENPKLRIIRRIDLFANMLPGDFVWWNTSLDWLSSSECFRLLIPWIEEAYRLPSIGMPAHSFTLVIDGSTKEASRIWELLKFVAATQEARTRQYRLRGYDPPPQPLKLDYWRSSLPTNFAKMIREIVEGSSVVKFEGDVGPLWDPDMFFYERRDWTEGQWFADWRDNVALPGIRTERPRHVAERYRAGHVPIRVVRRIVRHGERSSSSTE